MTSEPPPTTAWAPITHGPRAMALLATHTPSPMTMSRPERGMASWRSRPKALMSWVPVRTDTLWPKKAYSPTVMVPEPTLNRALLTTAVGWTSSFDRSPWTRYLYISTWASGPACLGSCSARTWRSGSRSQWPSSRAIRRSMVDISASCPHPPSRFARSRLSLSSGGGRGDRGPEPQRGAGRLHRLVDHGQQLGREGVQVDLLVQLAAERLDGGGGVVAAPVEAPVDGLLDPAAGRLEQGGHGQGGHVDAGHPPEQPRAGPDGQHGQDRQRPEHG